MSFIINQSINLSSSALKTIGLALFGSLVIALSSQIAIPLEPVPVTLQTLTVMLIAIAYGPRLAGATILCYLFEGAIGLPVFANWQGGLPILVGPHGGYLLGFLPAVLLTACLLQQKLFSHYFMTLLAIFLGTACIYAAGITYLTVLIGLDRAIKVGLLPFLGFELVKMMALAYVAPKLHR